MRIGFAGTPEFAAIMLQGLMQTKAKVVAVYCQPDRKSGRGQKIQACPVKTYAQTQNLPIEQPNRFNEQAQDILKNYQLDLLIVAAYGIILPQAVLDIPAIGCVNVHASLLPKYRGASPIQESIIQGDKETGITLMEMAAAMDAGPILQQATCAIHNDDTAASLHDRLAQLGQTLLCQQLPIWAKNGLKSTAQDDNKKTYAHKIRKTDAHMNWQEPIPLILRKIRAYQPWPIAYTISQNEEVIRIWGAGLIAETTGDHQPGQVIACTKDGLLIQGINHQGLCITQVQLAGKTKQPVAAIHDVLAKKITQINTHFINPAAVT